MPSPIGHALAGVATGWVVRGTPSARHGPSWREAGLFAVLGALPDIDLLFGVHSGPTHGVGSALLVGVLARFWAGRARVAHPWRFAIACACAYFSHTLLDWLGTDTSAPIGIMALWPFTREHYESGLHVFMAVSRRYWQGAVFWRHNALALLRELLILIPFLAAIHIGRRGRASASH